WLRLAVAGKVYFHLPETLAKYNWHPASATKDPVYTHELRSSMVYKLIEDPEFERSVGHDLYREFLKHQHRALASSLYNLGRWKESRKEFEESFRNGGFRWSGQSAGLYFKSFIKSALRTETTSQN
ncbi:MAG TPA: hypothetical protein VNA22_06890, partial [Pyrinomonadaceae bacterium]|nr:hypothetical protein [Pyrinomonadaceae bacterium]